MPQALQNFKDQSAIPPVSAAWLNNVDLAISLPSVYSVLSFASNPSGVQNGTADLAPALNSMLNSGETGMVIPNGNYILNSPVVMNNLSSVSTMLFTLWCYGYITVGPGFAAVGGNNFMLTINQSRMDIYGLMLDGGITGGASGAACTADGLNLLGGRMRVVNSRIQHFPNQGILCNGSSGDTYIIYPNIQQWNNGDPAWNTDANFTGAGIQISRPDIFVSGGYSRWSKYPARFTTGSSGTLDNRFHMYNGRSALSPMLDPIAFQIDSGAIGVKINNCYIDNGHGECFSYFVEIINNEILQTTASTFTADNTGNVHQIRVYPSTANDHPYGLKFRNTGGGVQAGTKLLGFPTTGGNTWSGSFAAFDAAQDGTQFTTVAADDGVIQLDTRIDNVRATTEYVKQGAQIVFRYTCAAGTTSIRTIATPSGGPNTDTYQIDTLQIQAVTGTVSTLQLGATNAAFYVDSSIDYGIVVHAGNTDRWKFASGGGFIPMSDALYNLGNTTNRISIAYFAPQLGVGTPFLEVDTCAQTDTFSASGKVLYIKCDGTTYKVQLGT